MYENFNQVLTRSLLLPLRFCMKSLRAAFSLSSASRCDFLLPPFPFFLPSFPLPFFLEVEWSTVCSPLKSSLRVSKLDFALVCVWSASECFFTSVIGSLFLSLSGVFFWLSCFSLSFPLYPDSEPALVDGLPLPELPVVLRMTNRERPLKISWTLFLSVAFLSRRIFCVRMDVVFICLCGLKLLRLLEPVFFITNLLFVILHLIGKPFLATFSNFRTGSWSMTSRMASTRTGYGNLSLTLMFFFRINMENVWYSTSR